MTNRKEAYRKKREKMIEEKGVTAFRTAETEVLAEISRKSGYVIATGGGIVTVDENYDLVHQNSTVVFVDRDINELASDGRPLTAKHGVKKLYEERIYRYNSWSDIKVRVHGINETALDIIHKLDINEGK